MTTASWVIFGIWCFNMVLGIAFMLLARKNHKESERLVEEAIKIREKAQENLAKSQQILADAVMKENDSRS